MKFGIFYEHQLPRALGRRRRAPAAQGRARPGRAGRPARHRLRVGGRAPLPRGVQPLVARPRCSSPPRSQRTSRIRLGHGIVQLPQGFNHSARVAERIATLDLVSDGRVEFGTGESSSEAELGGFGVDRGHQARAVGRGARRGDAHVRRGAVRRLRRRVPQDAAAQRRARSRCRSRTRRCGSRAAGARRSTSPPTKGIGALSFSFIEPDEAQAVGRRLLRHARVASECVPGGFAVNPNLAVVLPLHVPRGRGDRDRPRPRRRPLLRLLARCTTTSSAAPARASPTSGTSSRRTASLFGFDRDDRARRPASRSAPSIDASRASASLRGAIGTPDQVRELLRGYEEVGVDQVIFVSQAGNNRHEHICESLELFADEVHARVPRARPTRREGEARAPGPGDRSGPRPSRAGPHRRPRLLVPAVMKA